MSRLTHIFCSFFLIKKMTQITSQEKCWGVNMECEQHLWNIHAYMIVYGYPFFLFSLFWSEWSWLFLFLPCKDWSKTSSFCNQCHYFKKSSGNAIKSPSSIFDASFLIKLFSGKEEETQFVRLWKKADFFQRPLGWQRCYRILGMQLGQLEKSK